MRGIYKLAISCNLVASLVGFILFQFFPKPIIALFGTGDALYYEFAVHFMRIFLFMVLVNGVQLISSNFFSAIGKDVYKRQQDTLTAYIKGVQTSRSQVYRYLALRSLIPELLPALDEGKLSMRAGEKIRCV